MATPEEVYNSDTYRSVAEGRQGNHVPLAWFQDVYEALGKVLSAQQSVQADESNCSFQYHLMLAAKGDTVCGVCHQPLRR